MKKMIEILLFFTVSVALSTSAFGKGEKGGELDLDSARKKGLVMELPTGYLEATSDKAKKLADDINKKRKAAYEKIAKKNKLSVKVVGQQAAKKIQDKLKAEKK